MILEVYRIEKTGFQIYLLGYMGTTIEYETFFKFRRAEKSFVEKIWNLESIVLNLRVLVRKPAV
jgi:hypothetical protein